MIDINEHLHTGPIMFLYTGISALVFLNLMRLLAVWLESRSPSAARALGGLLTFSGDTR